MIEGLGARLLLLEFVYGDRYSQFRSRNYPFLLGQAHELGIPARWLCCWAPAGRDSRTRYVIDLDAEETAALLEQVARFDPTHLIVSEKLAAPLEERLRARLPAARVEDLAAAPTPRIVQWPASWLPRWLGRAHADDGRYLVDVATPRYESVLVPPPPARGALDPPRVHIVAGPECSYRVPLGRSGHFDDLALPAGVRPFGCSFCYGPQDVRYPFATPPVELALRQARAARATTARCSSRHEYVVDGAALTLRVHAFLRALLDEDFPPSRFFFSFRIDELLGLARRLAELLPRLAAAGHSLVIYNMGLENFSPTENARFNKGLTPEQIDRVNELLASWETQYPTVFRFTQSGGYGFILFTPWTTLADLEVNARHMRRRGIGSEGFVFTSKLQLVSEAAITALARRDGLIAESFAGFHYYDSGCFSRFDQRELPWRFRHPEVALLYAVSCRLVPVAPFPPGDRLLDEVQRLYGSRRDRWPTPLDFFEDALAATAQAPAPQSAAEILARVAASAAARPPPPPATPAVPPPSREAAALLEELQARLGDRPRAFGGFRVGSAAATGRPCVEVVLQREAAGHVEQLVLYVHRRAGGAPHYLAAGRYTLAFAATTPLDTVSRRRALQAFATFLALA